MLAPGEYLLNPVPPEPKPPLSDPGCATTTVVALTAVANPTHKPDERPSFLLILLRALGAIHT